MYLFWIFKTVLKSSELETLKPELEATAFIKLKDSEACVSKSVDNGK